MISQVSHASLVPSFIDFFQVPLPLVLPDSVVFLFAAIPQKFWFYIYSTCFHRVLLMLFLVWMRWLSPPADQIIWFTPPPLQQTDRRKDGGPFSWGRESFLSLLNIKLCVLFSCWAQFVQFIFVFVKKKLLKLQI